MYVLQDEADDVTSIKIHFSLFRRRFVSCYNSSEQQANLRPAIRPFIKHHFHLGIWQAIAPKPDIPGPHAPPRIFFKLHIIIQQNMAQYRLQDMRHKEPRKKNVTSSQSISAGVDDTTYHPGQTCFPIPNTKYVVAGVVSWCFTRSSSPTGSSPPVRNL